MNIRELSKPITSQKLNESLAKQFGYKINLEQFTDVQLEDARNKLRTKMSQFELSESFDAIHESQDYQKTRMFLDVLNQELLERDESEEEDNVAETSTINGKVQDPKGMRWKQTGLSREAAVEKYGKANVRVASRKSPSGKDVVEVNVPLGESRTISTESYMSATIRSRANAARIPAAWINSAIRRMDLGESERSELSSELTLRYDLSESQAAYVLAEGEENKAATIMATKDMVDKITGWLEDVAAMKAETLLELLDSIREESGSDVAQRYQDSVKPALEAIYATLETSRGGLQGALAVVSGGEPPSMGSDMPAMGAGGPQGADALGAEIAAGPAPGAEIGGPDIAPPSAALGARAKRESIDYSRKLGMLLSSKKK
jgi:hypothetical protein